MMHLVEMALGKLPHEIKAFRIHLHNKNNMKDRKRGKREKQPRYFLEKLFNLLQKHRYPEIIRWTNDGKGVVILNKIGLIKEILAYEFQQSSYKSFTKQMNLYNFKTSKDESGHSVFYNDNFKRDYQNIAEMMTLKKQIQKLKVEEYDYKKEHEQLKTQLGEMIRRQQIICKAIRDQVLIQRYLQKQVEYLRWAIHQRKERGITRRRRIYQFFNTFFGSIKSGIISHKFLILNHDLLCQCENDDKDCHDFSISRSIYQTPYLTPNSHLWTLQQQESIRLIQSMLVDERNNPKSFMQLSDEQKVNYIESIWSE